MRHCQVRIGVINEFAGGGDGLFGHGNRDLGADSLLLNIA
jgi:hypothetical protein